jgi:3-oxoacyl-[acyl-carrier protein] reductase
LGREIAHHFIGAGADAVLVAREETRLQQAVEELSPSATRQDQRLTGVRGDVSDPAACAALVRGVAESLGPQTPLVLVNNAGVYGPKGEIERVDWEEWVRAIEINLFGTALMSREVIPLMRERGYGKIINLSGGGATGPLPRISAYAASKAAVVRLTETIAEETRDAGIDVNAIAPGALNTRLLDEVITAGPELVGERFYRRSLEQRESGGVPPEKGAALAAFLASAESDGITGRLLSAVWDDWADLPGKREALAASDVYTLRRIVPADRDWDG